MVRVSQKNPPQSLSNPRRCVYPWCMAPGSRRSGSSLEPLPSHARSLDPRVQTATPTRNFSQSHEPRVLERVLACCVLKCAWVSDHTVPSAGSGCKALLDGTRQCSAFSNPLGLLETRDRSKLPNAWKLQNSASGLAQSYHDSARST